MKVYCSLGCMHATIFLQQDPIFSGFFTHVYHRLVFHFALPFGKDLFPYLKLPSPYSLTLT